MVKTAEEEFQDNVVRVAGKPGPKKGTRPSGRAKGVTEQRVINREERLEEMLKKATEVLGEELMRLEPKDVLLMVMRVCLQAGWIFKAAEMAQSVAPYVHAKLQATTLTNGNPDEQRSDEDLEAELAEIRERAAKTRGPRPKPVADKTEDEEEGAEAPLPPLVVPGRTEVRTSH